MDIKTIITTVEAGAEHTLTAVKGVIATVEGTISQPAVATILQDTNVGTKLANLLSDAETSALPIIQKVEKLFTEVKADIEQIVGQGGNVFAEAINVEHLVVAAVTTFIADFKSVV